MRQFTLAQDLIPLFEEKLEKFVKKYGNYVHYSFSKSEPYRCDDEDSPWYRCMLVDLDLDATYKLGDYEFVCSLEWNEEAQENLIKKACEDVVVPPQYKYSNKCDHCGTNRYRKSTVLLRNLATNDYVQVGKGCVKEYVGIDLGRYASYLSWFTDLEDYVESCKHNTGARYTHYYTIDEVLLQTLEEVRQHGYISKQQSWDMECDSTSSRVYKALTRYVAWGDTEPKYKMYTPTDVTYEELRQLKSFFLDEGNLKEEEKTDYVSNIQTLMKSTTVEPDNLGLLVSSVGCKMRMQKQRKEKEQRSTSKFVGTVGERIVFTAKPECVFSSENEYGFFHIYKMIVEGDEIIWKTSKMLDCNLEYEFSATVKSQEEFQGVKQTEVTRARVK